MVPAVALSAVSAPFVRVLFFVCANRKAFAARRLYPINSLCLPQSQKGEDDHWIEELTVTRRWPKDLRALA
jgi:hypothetical protein